MYVPAGFVCGSGAGCLAHLSDCSPMCFDAGSPMQRNCAEIPVSRYLDIAAQQRYPDIAAEPAAQACQHLRASNLKLKAMGLLACSEHTHPVAACQSK